MTCCRHTVDDHSPAGCTWCSCNVTRATHPAAAEVDALEDWRRLGGKLASWTTSVAWTTPPADAARPAPVAGEIGSATPAQEAWLAARIDRLKPRQPRRDDRRAGTDAGQPRARTWREVLGVPADGWAMTAPPIAVIAYVRDRHRELIRAHHPDVGGDPLLAAEINAALDQAVAELAP